MQVLRRQRGFGLLALMALALQLVLSFAHHHDHEAAPRKDAVTSGACVPGFPADCPAHDDDDDDCSICWTMALSAATVLTAPSVPHAPPGRPVGVVRPKAMPAAHADLTASPFEARAPPIRATI